MDKIESTIAVSVSPPVKRTVNGNALLNVAAKFWFIIAVLGQWIFAAYVAVFYGGTAARGELEAWTEALPHGIIAGDSMGNFALAGHLLLAVVIIVGGPLQFIPQFRKALPSFHRWNGRIYVFLVIITSIFGLYMIWTRGTVGGLVLSAGTSLDGILIILFAIFAWRYALIRKFDIHRRWTLRLFMVVSGVWFFRIGLMFWLLINGGPVGFDPETFTGPFLSFWTFGQYLVPLAVLELYFFAREQSNEAGKFAMATGLFILTLAMGLGIFGATMGMWLPQM